MQSSIFGSALSFLGVDGNNDTNFNHGSCAATNGEISPWWAVDLGSPMDVYGVDFTNRGDAFGMIDWFNHGRFSLLILSHIKHFSLDNLLISKAFSNINPTVQLAPLTSSLCNVLRFAYVSK